MDDGCSCSRRVRIGVSSHPSIQTGQTNVQFPITVESFNLLYTLLQTAKGTVIAVIAGVCVCVCLCVCVFEHGW